MDKKIEIGFKIPEAYEPKKINRWFITFPSEFKIDSWVVSSTERPSITMSGNTTTINPINICLMDPVGPSTTQKLINIIRASPSNTISDKNNLDSGLIEILKNGFDYDLEMLDPVGDSVEKWTISGCEIISVNFGELNYSNSEPIKCNMLVQPKSFKLHN